LTVRNVSSPKGAFRDVSFSVHRGEIVGIAGIVGAGRTELVRAITGADPLASGEVLLEGKPLRLRSPRDAIDAGMVMVPESRKQQGLILQHTLADNMAFGNFDLLQSGFWVSPAKIKDFAARAIRRMGIKGSPGQQIANLSGGNQQKVVIAKWVSRNPKVFILDEPTRGIDVGARAAIYNVIAELASTGMAVVVVSSDLEEVLGLSHRVLVLSRGRQRGLLDRKDANHVAVMELATT
jgi:ribose transport system ATP-binding protein